MSATPEGGKRAAQKNTQNEPDFYRRIGAMGGKAPHKARGFSAMSKQRHLEASAKGGANSKRGKWSVDEYLSRARYYADKQEQLNRQARGEA